MSRWIAALVLLLATAGWGQTPATLLTDEQARAAAAQRAKQTPYQHDCSETARREALEDSVFELRPDKIQNGSLNNSIFFYDVSDFLCYQVLTKPDGGSSLIVHAVDHGGVIGTVAVDRATGETYWFDYTDQSAAEFARLIRTIRPIVRDEYDAKGVADLYRDLVHRPQGTNVLWELDLKQKAEDNFSSAWSPYAKDRAWERRLERWWKALRAARPQLDYEVHEKREATGFLVTGLAFRGYPLTIPRKHPPPKETPSLVRWRLLVHADGSVEDRGTETVFEYKP